MNKRTLAWLLDCGGGVRVAVALHSLLHLIEDTALLQRVPVVPRHLGQVLLWQERLFPVIDVALLVSGTTPATPHTYVCMLGWHDATNASDYGGLLIRELPRRIQIQDDAVAKPTARMVGQWQHLAVTYFDHQGQVIPIIAPAALFEPVARLERASSNAPGQRQPDTRRA